MVTKLESMMYRAYPAPPSQSAAQRLNDQGNSTSQSPPQRRQQQVNGQTFSQRGPIVPGLANPLSINKQRATRNAPDVLASKDELIKMTDERIARRREELKKLHSHRSSTAELLARARAITSGSSAVARPGQHGQVLSHSNVLPPNANGGVQAYNSRTQPIALPKSPIRQRSANAPVTSPPSQDSPTNGPVPGGTKFAINSNNNNMDYKPRNEPSKPKSPNPKVAVQTPSLPPSEMTNIKPIINITDKESTQKNSAVSPPTTVPLAVPTTQPMHTASSSLSSASKSTPQPSASQSIQNNNSQPSVPPVPKLIAEQQSKRETLNHFRDIAQSPSLPPQSSPLPRKTEQPIIMNNQLVNTGNETVTTSAQSKIMKELIEVKTLRENDLRQIAQLQKEVMELRLEREQDSIQNQDRSRSMNRTPTRKRMKSPLPSNRSTYDVSTNPLSDLNVACRAVETVDDSYTSDLATYIVRKPYGGNENMEHVFKQNPDNSDYDCKISWYEPVKKYLDTANVQEEASIEVLAKISADNSVLLLYGSSCRHGTAVVGNEGHVVDYEWKNYNDIEKMEKALGRIIYIDSHGNDGEYWLDTIYEEALKIRENFCSNVFSAALALKVVSPQNTISNLIPQKNGQLFYPQTSPIPIEIENSHNIPKITKPPTKTIGVGTSDDFPQPPQQQVQAKNIQSSSVPPKQQSVTKMDPVVEEIGSSDPLSSFFILFFGGILNIMWQILLMPIKIMKFAMVCSFFAWALSILWLLFADDNGAGILGAGIDYHFNPPGIY